MSSRRRRGAARGACAAIAALALAAASGCGVGPGERSEGKATLTVSNDYGAEQIVEKTIEDPTGSETVLRLLDRNAAIETRYGGGFVQSIEGLAGGTENGRREDWFFYVNGVESPVGAAEVEVGAGDRIWWDHHDWTDVMRVPVVVGSWPAPFATGGRSAVVCMGEAAPCELTRDRIENAGGAVVQVDGEGPRFEQPDGGLGATGVRVLVGPWEDVRRDPLARSLERGPRSSGVFVRVERAGEGWRFTALDATLAEREDLPDGSALVAAVGEEDRLAWLVTGPDEQGAAAAAELLDEEALAGRFAVATDPGGDISRLPIP